jgi:hypothetical protein
VQNPRIKEKAVKQPARRDPAKFYLFYSLRFTSLCPEALQKEKNFLRNIAHLHIKEANLTHKSITKTARNNETIFYASSD